MCLCSGANAHPSMVYGCEGAHKKKHCIFLQSDAMLSFEPDAEYFVKALLVLGKAFSLARLQEFYFQLCI